MRKKTIVLVEDNPDEVVLARRAFAQQGPDVTLRVAEDGESAYRMLAEDEPVLPDVVLLDLKLPGSDGFDVLRRLRAHPHTRLLPIILFTSSDEPRDLITGYACGANSCLRKPSDFDRFVELVRDINRYWLQLNEFPMAGTAAS